MMQIAYTAKMNSACISRQVGASVTNKYGSLKAIGWNSVAEGQTPCLLRSKSELLTFPNTNAYSRYEQTGKFKKSLQKFYPKIPHKRFKGCNDSFCFKSIYNKQEGDANQVHTRALHAEENAFLQISKYGGEGIRGGTLYSTASPCELCSKKAYQLGISRIVYIDPYPGIAQDQILSIGVNPPKVELFKGAIGTAYHKLFEPLLKYKDELSALSN
jgi:dCMP deaminase